MSSKAADMQELVRRLLRMAERHGFSTQGEGDAHAQEINTLKLNYILVLPHEEYMLHTSWVGAVSRRLKVLKMVAASHPAALKSIESDLLTHTNSGLQFKSCRLAPMTPN